MKREIKFRAWDSENKIMLYGNNGLMMFLTCGVLAWQFADDLDILSSYTKQDKYELMQFTGLKDKNGKGIYEGDIVSPVTMNGTITGGAVDFNYGSFVVKQIGAEGLVDDLYRYDNCEVIGNLFENPELLNQ